MIEHVVIIFGILGTGLLALDLAQPRLLRIINVNFKLIIKLKFSSSIIWKPIDKLTLADKKVVEAIKMLSVYTFFLLILFTYPFLNYESSSYIKYFLLVFLGLPVLSLALFNVSTNIGLFLIRIINIISYPTLIIYFYLFLIVGIIFQFIVRHVFSLEKAYLAKLQAPRFIGLFMLFLSFFLQLF